MDEKFIELLTKELSGEINEQELIDLRALLNSNDIYKSRYKNFRMYWEHKEADYSDDALLFKKVQTKISNYQHETGDNITAEPAVAAASKVSWLFYTWRSVAALLTLGCCGLLLYNLLNPTHRVVFEQKTTARRAKSIITLSDGTRVTLNSESSLKYPTAFNNKTREVYLQGEAFFNVHKDHQHPFIIHTGKMNVRVLGTEFNVRSYPNDSLSETSLIRGSIEVTLNDRPSDRIILKPKEKLIVQNNGLSLKPAEANKNNLSEKVTGTKYTLTTLTYLNKKDTTADIETSWLKNKLVARNETFKDLAEKMDRWYGVDIHFSDRSFESLRFTVSFEKENINQALDALKLTENFHYKVDDSNIYIY